MVTFDGEKFRHVKNNGLVKDVFTKEVRTAPLDASSSAWAPVKRYSSTRLPHELGAAFTILA